MRGIRAVNLGLRFLLELAALAALAYWGFHTGQTVVTDVLLGVGVPLVAAAIWGAFAAPQAARRLRGAALIALQLTVLGAGALALALAGRPVLGAILAGIIAVNAILLSASEPA